MQPGGCLLTTRYRLEADVTVKIEKQLLLLLLLVLLSSGGGEGGGGGGGGRRRTYLFPGRVAATCGRVLLLTVSQGISGSTVTAEFLRFSALSRY